MGFIFDGMNLLMRLSSDVWSSFLCDLSFDRHHVITFQGDRIFLWSTFQHLRLKGLYHLLSSFFYWSPLMKTLNYVLLLRLQRKKPRNMFPWIISSSTERMSQNFSLSAVRFWKSISGTYGKIIFYHLWGFQLNKCVLKEQWNESLTTLV